MRKDELLQRIGIAYRFIHYGIGKCRIMTCGKCGSPLRVPISDHPIRDSRIEEERHIDLIWSEVNQCMKCGAVCQELQLWNFEGDPTELNKGFVAKGSSGD